MTEDEYRSEVVRIVTERQGQDGIPSEEPLIPKFIDAIVKKLMKEKRGMDEISAVIDKAQTEGESRG